jgi:uncharacterized protein YbjT (DUF2867 family)
MSKKILITGATGMIGGLILEIALKDDLVSEVVSIVRKKSTVSHPKLKEVIISDFLDYHSIEDSLHNIDAVYYCLGVYTGKASRDEFRKITVDYPAALAKELVRYSPKAIFCLLSGQGADRSEKSSLMFAKDKGAIENLLSGLGFKAFYTFRPSYIYSVTLRNEPNFIYKLMRVIYPLVRLLGKNFSIRSTVLANAMYKVGLEGTDKEVLENKDITQLA